MTQPTHINFNNAKRTRRSTSKTSPGERTSMQQDTFDRQQMTVYNKRSKVHIATWNVLRIHQPGKHKKGTKLYESGCTRSRRSKNG